MGSLAAAGRGRRPSGARFVSRCRPVVFKRDRTGGSVLLRRADSNSQVRLFDAKMFSAGVRGLYASTVSREITRNGDYDRYRAALADEKAWIRARRPKRCKLANNRWLRQVVVQKLRLNWAPEEIAGWLKRAHPEDELSSVPRDDLSQSICSSPRGA